MQKKKTLLPSIGVAVGIIGVAVRIMGVVIDIIGVAIVIIGGKTLRLEFVA